MDIPGPSSGVIHRRRWTSDGNPNNHNAKMKRASINIILTDPFYLRSVPKPADAVAPPAEPAPQARKQSKITIIPAQPNSERNTTIKPSTNKAKASTDKGSSKLGENGRVESTSSSKPQLERQTRIDKSRSRTDTRVPISKSESTTGAPTLSKSSSRAAIPPPPPPRPPPPPPSREVVPELKNLPPISEKAQKTLELLKSRPRKRPDWSCILKEVESGKKLKHVKCNDRSAPIIERVSKVIADPQDQPHFVFESEKSNMHNQLLHQIQTGIKLKSVKTNDRSKPMLEGLRKFRRQLTIEEQIQRKEAAPDIAETVPDEMDDIDAVRDDLQSTKQMLALELRNKEALERDNKRLQARVLNLEAELERAKLQQNVVEHKKQDEKIQESLKKEAEAARKDVEKLEKDFAVVAEERDKTKIELEEMKRMYANLERRMKAGMALAGCPSAKDVAKIASQKSIDKGEKTASESEEEEESSEEEDEDEDPEAQAEKRLQREIKLLNTKIRNFKDKAANAKKERHALKEQIKQQQKLLKEEKKKYKGLQKEVDKMAKLMGDTDDEDAEDEEEEEEEESESEDESESEESEEEESESDDEDAEPEERKSNLQTIVKKHEGRMSSLKKGNYLLKAQVDRLKDDLVKQREASLSLQEDLDSVLAELG
ncbi:glutamic acid-rich protein isoform X2 [Diachasma alloeum]|uniref:glutamic acid-rich protein isoform X2 n=1 Tax=Diachasma alloeum TaxID=454923 RepID=UPI0007383336|nr:glutamic acid-rich protein isoform X2 [Diachasma alloeum]